MEGQDKSHKSNTNCCVYGCHSVRKREYNLKFHKFPSKGSKILVQNRVGDYEEQDHLALWENALHMGKKSTKHMKVCSLHFREEDYEVSGWSSYKGLKPHVVPSQNIPQRSYERQRNDNKLAARTQRYEARRRNRFIKDVEAESTSVMAGWFPLSFIIIYLRSYITEVGDPKHEAAVGLVMLQSEAAELEEPRFKDVAVQVDPKDFDLKIVNFRECGVQVNEPEFTDTIPVGCLRNENLTDKQLNSLTGLQSFLLLHTLADLYSTCFKESRKHKISIQNRIFLTFCKLKLDISYVVLSIWFDVSSQTCKNIFFETISNLSKIMKGCIRFPSKDEIMHNMTHNVSQNSKKYALFWIVQKLLLNDLKNCAVRLNVIHIIRELPL